ncbi:MAG: thiamine diphosphokinase [Chloroflexi bacterium]|nr:thiamine diphosphokinase [Chloroflexota bacterium]
MRAIIFANGSLGDAEAARSIVQTGDMIIAADGGGDYCRQLDIKPHILIGDFDSLAPKELSAWERQGVQIVRHPERKNYTDLELALEYAREQGADEILVLAALGARWDHTLANLFLPVLADLQRCSITLLDGRQEIHLIKGGETLEVHGAPGDTLSLIPLGGEALGVSTVCLEYPLQGETLHFGSTRGVSNVLLAKTAAVSLDQGLLLCVVIHQ